MAPLDSRSRIILLLLLESGGSTTIERLSEKIGLTRRQTDYALNRLEIWLNEKGYRLHKKTGKGVAIIVSPADRKKLLNEVDKATGYELILTREERVRLLIFLLLTADGPMQIKNLAPKIGVSQQTLYQDLDFIQPWLSEYELDLNRKPGSGVHVSGPEPMIRAGLESIVLNTATTMNILGQTQGTALQHHSLEELKHGLERTGVMFGQKFEVAFCQRMLSKIERAFPKITDSSRLSFFLFLCVSIFRIRQGHLLQEVTQPDTGLADKPEYALASDLGQIIQKELRLTLNQAEILNIAIELLAIKRQHNPGESPGEESRSVLGSEEFEEILSEILQLAAGLLHPILLVDEQLKQGLRFHLEPAINRVFFNLPFQNNLLSEIKAKYPYIFHVAKKSCKIIENRLDKPVPDEEVGYLAMHLGAAMERMRLASTRQLNTVIVCGGGCSTAWMLVSRLAAEFPELNVTQVYSVNEMRMVGPKNIKADLVITSIPLQVANLSVITVNPLLGVMDKLQIRQFLRSANVGSYPVKVQDNPEEALSITSLIEREAVQLSSGGVSRDEAIDECCRPLLEMGFVEPQFVQDIKSLLSENGPYMVIAPGVALLHARVGLGVNKLSMSMTIFENPVIFGHTFHDPVKLAFVMAATDNHTHLKALWQLSRLLMDKSALDNVIAATSTEEMWKQLFLGVTDDIGAEASNSSSEILVPLPGYPS